MLGTAIVPSYLVVFGIHICSLEKQYFGQVQARMFWIFATRVTYRGNNSIHQYCFALHALAESNDVSAFHLPNEYADIAPTAICTEHLHNNQ